LSMISPNRAFFRPAFLVSPKCSPEEEFTMGRSFILLASLPSHHPLQFLQPCLLLGKR
jgi:hypothetical protein